MVKCMLSTVNCNAVLFYKHYKNTKHNMLTELPMNTAINSKWHFPSSTLLKRRSVWWSALASNNKFARMTVMLIRASVKDQVYELGLRTGMGLWIKVSDWIVNCLKSWAPFGCEASSGIETPYASYSSGKNAEDPDRGMPCVLYIVYECYNLEH